MSDDVFASDAPEAEKPFDAYDYRTAVAEAMRAGFSEEVIKAAKKQIDDIHAAALDDLEWRLKDDLGENLAWHAHEMFRRAMEAMLAGNEEMFRRYLNADPHGFTGRDRRHHIINGKVSEHGCIEWRRALVDAFPEVLKSERILDLEDQVRSLAEQNQELEARYHALIQRGM